jgi:hypothetical protein
MKTLLLLLGLAPSLALADNCRHEAARNLDIPREGAKIVGFELSSADVEIEGVKGMAGIEIRGRACASDEARLSEMTLEQRREGDRIVVVAQVGRKGNASWFGNYYTGFRLRVKMAPELAVAIQSSSGDAQVDGVAAVQFDGSSGDLQVNDVPGEVSVGLSSGDVRAERIGPLNVRKISSGDLTARDIRGDARVASVSSGDVRLSDVRGEVTIGRAGSGDVSLREVGCDVRIGPVGSGDVNIDGVGGNLSLASREDDEDVHYRHVAGKVTFDADVD